MRYRTASSFRQALEQHLKTRAKGDDARLSRDRKRIAFDRLLARLNAIAPDRWLLGFRVEPIEEVDALVTPNLLAFADIEPVVVPAMPLALQLAEKLHAYTREYEGGRTNTRVKDLIDLVLVAELAEFDAAQVRARITATFSERATHDPPVALPPPPPAWRAPFRDLANAVGLSPNLEEGHAAAATLVDPLLDGRVTAGSWAPASRHWR